MGVIDYRPTCCDDLLQWPCPTPVEESRFQLDGVERGRDIADNPEDQPQRRPRLPYDHRDVFRRKSKRIHPDKVEHPVD